MRTQKTTAGSSGSASGPGATSASASLSHPLAEAVAYVRTRTGIPVRVPEGDTAGLSVTATAGADRHDIAP